jgi:glycosyltransferase involved in cell wall biosynthesis
MARTDAPKHICIVYDCLYPWTIGGAERWYRNLAQRLAAGGHTVTYLTLRQWDQGDPPQIPGVRVIAVGPRLDLYTKDGSGRRRIQPPIAFGAGCLWHLLRHGRNYDVVHTASFPYFSLLAAAAVRRRGRYGVVVDWHEVWSREYWREYLGAAGGALGSFVQGLCARVTQRAFCFSRLSEARLLASGLRGSVQVLEGEFEGSAEGVFAPADPPVVVFGGRLIPEKRAPAVVHAVAEARKQLPTLRGVVFGAGPDTAAVERAIVQSGMTGVVDAPGFVDSEVFDEAMRHALCLLLPSRREGYGLVVVEAAARGVPSIVVAGPDNAAVEIVEHGVNGFVSPTAGAADLAEAIAAVRRAGPQLRESTAAWYEHNAARLSLAGSLERVLLSYGVASPAA